MSKRYEFPSKWNRSVATFVQGNIRTSWPNAACVPGFFFDLEYFRHNWQLRTSCSSWLFSPGQYTACFAWSLHFVSPRWLSWICLRIASHFLCGMTIWVPFRMRPSSMVNSLQNVQYGCRTCGISLMLLGHPIIMVCFRSASLLSVWVAYWISCKLSHLAGSWWEIWYTRSFSSLMVSFWFPNLDKQSARRFFCPEMYLTVKL